MNPKVSVIMSVYNGEKYIREAIESILKQTFNDFEFIIIDDGSSDNTLGIIKSYQDTRIKIIKNDANLGVSLSKNRGFDIASGEYIAIMDADDISYPARFEKEVLFLDNNKNIGLVGTYYVIIDGDDRLIERVTPPIDSIVLKEGMLEKNQLGHGTIMFRRECLTRVGQYREEFKSSLDYDFLLRFTEKYDVSTIPEVLYAWRLNLHSITISKRINQEIFSSLAIKLATQRRTVGIDDLQTFDKTYKDNYIKLYISSFNDVYGIKRGYQYYVTLLFKIKKYGEGFEIYKKYLKYLLDSIKCNPVNIKYWYYLAKAITTQLIYLVTYAAITYCSYSNTINSLEQV